MKDADFDFIDISHIHLSVMIKHFFCTLPTSFFGNKIPNDHIQHVPNTEYKKGDHRVIKNESPNIYLENLKQGLQGSLHGQYSERLPNVQQEQTFLQKVRIKRILLQRIQEHH